MSSSGVEHRSPWLLNSTRMLIAPKMYYSHPTDRVRLHPFLGDSWSCRYNVQPRKILALEILPVLHGMYRVEDRLPFPEVGDLPSSPPPTGIVVFLTAIRTFIGMGRIHVQRFIDTPMKILARFDSLEGDLSWVVVGVKPFQDDLSKSVKD